MRHLYYSSAEIVLDGKGRVMLPADMREVLAQAESVEAQSRLYLSRRSPGDSPVHLACFSRGLIESLSGELDYCTPERAYEIESLLMATDLVKVDTGGRFSLGPGNIEALGLTDKVLILGLGRFFEIWHPDHRDDSQSALLSSYRRVLRVMPTSQAKEE